MNGFILELVNGTWGIASASLAVICAIYLLHEGVAYRILKRGGRARITRPMRVMLGVLTLAVGVAVRSLEVTAWRMRSGELADLSQFWLIFGSCIALVGFLCLIREISQPLYGAGPWAWTLAAMALYTLGWSIWRFV